MPWHAKVRIRHLSFVTRHSPLCILHSVFCFAALAAFAARAANLPDGYTEVEYLTSVGAGSVFDTGYVFTNKPLVKTTAMILSNGDADIAGTAVAQGGCFIVDYWDARKTLYYRYSSSGSTAMGYTESVLNRWVDYEWGETIKHDGVLVGSVPSYDFSSNTQTFQLFGGRTCLLCSIKAVEMYDGDELVRHYIPCFEHASRRAGMYDAVEGAFHPVNAVPARIVEPVDAPTGIVEAKYLESTGTEYIDTGYVFTNAPRVDVSFLIVRFATELPSTVASKSDLMGMPAANEPCFSVNIVPTGSGSYNYQYGSASTVSISTSLVSRRWYEGSFGTNVVQDGVTLATVPAASFTANGQTFRLFMGRTGQAPSLVRFRNVRVYDGDVLVRDFAPCYCGSFGEFGFLDRVEGRFYPSVGQPFRSVPIKVKPMRRAEYLESSGSQLLDTDVVFTNTPLVKARMRLVEEADKDVAGTSTAAADCFIIDYNPKRTGSGILYYRYASANSATRAFNGGVDEWRDYEWGPTVRHDGVEILTVTVADGAFASNRRPFTLFGARTNALVAFSSVQMFENGEMVRDFIPAVYKGEAGMYDKVEGFFYFNCGSGEFETGRVFSDATVIMAR